MSPFARTGGLGDVLEAFPAELKSRGHEVSVVLPFYRVIHENRAVKTRHTGVSMTIQLGQKRVDAEVFECTAPNGVQVFLVRRDEYFDRSGLYGAESHTYDDNAERFIFFQKAVVEMARRISPQPDIIHVHDWQTAMVPVFVTERRLPFKTVLTIHNLAYQGSFLGVDFNLTNLPGEYFAPRGVEFYGNLNFLKSGILYSDAVVTVSERYAREIQGPEYGCGLDIVLREQGRKLRGIISGVDYTIWNPATDNLIAKNYSPEDLAPKNACRDKLLTELGLAKNPAGPVFSMVTRLSEQKGLDLLLPTIDRLLSDDVRLIILGEGETRYERELQIAARKYPDTFAFRRGWEERLAHRIEAGTDISLIPSHQDPSGLNAMYSLKYGVIPVARACGGLHQVIQDYDPSSKAGNGFLFYDYTPEALWDCIGRAKRLFAQKQCWGEIMRNAMNSDFSWAATAAEYEKLYEWVTGN